MDRRDPGSGIGDELLLHADILTQEWLKVRAGTRTRLWFQRQILPWLRDEVHRLLVAGSHSTSEKSAVVCKDLLSLEVSLWTFATRPGVEPTNNAAERAVRHAACWRKTSDGTGRQTGRESVRRTDLDRRFPLPVSGPGRDGISHASHHGPPQSVPKAVTPGREGVNAYREMARQMFLNGRDAFRAFSFCPSTPLPA